MTIFKLPDLGEGLLDAEIHEWFVEIGQVVTEDQPLVSMETAKAIVDVPCPYSGTLTHRFGNPGDLIQTGAALAAFETTAEYNPRSDQGTVVGHLEISDIISDDDFIIGAPTTRVKITPRTRAHAKQLGVDIQTLIGTGEYGVITLEDVQRQASTQTTLTDHFEPLRGVRRAMSQSMSHAHQTVVSATVSDEVDIAAWEPNTDITVRLIRAMCHACQVEPALNAWFDTGHNARRLFDAVHLGLAMDAEDGLFVPVIKHAETRTDEALRSIIGAYKLALMTRSIPTAQLSGASIILSNFGKFAGRFATPIVLPPTVAIMAVGRKYMGVVSANGSIKAHPCLPLSLSFDHRAVTGGEATRFLGAMKDALQRSEDREVIQRQSEGVSSYF
jgi:pyruvate dehydrogenase E2 component (dihydrolipoamide acetyltransferase)